MMKNIIEQQAIEIVSTLFEKWTAKFAFCFSTFGEINVNRNERTANDYFSEIEAFIWENKIVL